MAQRNREMGPMFWLGVFLATALVRVAVALLASNPTPPVDAQVYDLMARNLANHGVLSKDKQPPVRPSGYREPGYPFFIAACYRLLGERPMTAVVVQSVIGAAGPVLFCLLVVELAGTRRWWLVALSWAVAMILPWLATRGWIGLMREDLLNAFLLVGVYIAVVRPARPTVFSAVALGILAGAGMLLKASFAVFLPPLILVWVVRHRWRGLAGSAVLTATVIVCLAPWVVRNQVQFGQPALTCTKGLLLYLHSGRPERLDGVEPEYRRLANELATRWPEAARDTLQKRYALDTQPGWCHFCHVFWYTIAGRENITLEQADTVLSRLAADDIKSDPLRYLRNAAATLGAYLTVDLIEVRPLPVELRARPVTAKWLFHLGRRVALIGMELLACIGLVVFRRRSLAWLAFLVAGCSFATNSIIADGQMRYRLFSDVLLAVLALAVLAAAVGAIARRRAEPPAASLSSTVNHRGLSRSSRQPDGMQL
jgi:hypothetical protein